jgi:cysteine-S-conjugate beta-lyase
MTTKKTSSFSAFGLKTRLVHAGRDPSSHDGFVNTPIYRGSTILHESIEDLQEGRMRFSYATKGTPTIAALEDAWTELSGAAGTVLSPSGLGALALALMSCLKSGDHLLVTDSVYRPTRSLCDGLLQKFGVETSYYDPAIGADIATLMRPNTKAVLTESPGSESFEIQDIPAIVAAAHANGAVVLIDNTWATPLFFDAHAHGVDLVIEAGTKYLGGASDLLLGLVSSNQKCWPLLRKTFDALAMCAGPEDAFLALRGLRTMPLRLKEHEKQALDMAHWLQKRPEVADVLHPALETHPGHSLWKRDYKGSSGLFSVVLKPASETAVHAMLNHLQLFGIGYSWGGFQSLVVPFDCASYRTVSSWKPKGPSLRFHIGLEDVEDLKADLEAGFRRLRKIV